MMITPNLEYYVANGPPNWKIARRNFSPKCMYVVISWRLHTISLQEFYQDTNRIKCEEEDDAVNIVFLFCLNLSYAQNTMVFIFFTPCR